MTVYRIVVKSARKQKENPSTVPKPEPPALEDVMPDRVKNFRDKHGEDCLPEQATGSIPHTAKDVGFNYDHVRTVIHYPTHRDLNTILDDIEADMLADVAHYKIDVAVSHRNEPRATASPDESYTTEREGGNPPDGL
jgi:hypothetical protein